MTKLLFVGMLPPDSHNPEERRFVEELCRHLDEVRYVRGIGIKGVGTRQLRSVLRQWASGKAPAVRRLFIVPPRRLWHPLNVLWLRRQLLTFTEERPQDWVIWTRFPSPELVEAIEVMKFRSMVYEPIDKYDASLDFTPRERQRLAVAESRLTTRAAVIAGSAGVAHRFAHTEGGSTWLPFGRDCKVVTNHEELLATTGAPRIGIVAEFDWRVDERQIGLMARERPDWQIVLVGPRSKKWGRTLQHLPNVDLVGRVEPEFVPVAVRSFDVALIPYVTNDWTQACLPVKVYEYLAEGRPVVSTDLPELAPFSDVLDLVSPGCFVSAVSRALATDTLAARQRRVEASTRFTLQDRARLAASLLQDQPLTVAAT